MNRNIWIILLIAFLTQIGCGSENKKASVERNDCLPKALTDRYGKELCLGKSIKKLQESNQGIRFNKSVGKYVSTKIDDRFIVGFEFTLNSEDCLDSLAIFMGSQYGLQDIARVHEEVDFLSSIFDTTISKDESGEYWGKIGNVDFCVKVVVYEEGTATDVKLLFF